MLPITCCGALRGGNSRGRSPGAGSLLGVVGFGATLPVNTPLVAWTAAMLLLTAGPSCVWKVLATAAAARLIPHRPISNGVGLPGMSHFGTPPPSDFPTADALPSNFLIAAAALSAACVTPPKPLAIPDKCVGIAADATPASAFES